MKRGTRWETSSLLCRSIIDGVRPGARTFVRLRCRSRSRAPYLGGGGFDPTFCGTMKTCPLTEDGPSPFKALHSPQDHAKMRRMPQPIRANPSTWAIWRFPKPLRPKPQTPTPISPSTSMTNSKTNSKKLSSKPSARSTEQQPALPNSIKNRKVATAMNTEKKYSPNPTPPTPHKAHSPSTISTTTKMTPSLLHSPNPPTLQSLRKSDRNYPHHGPTPPSPIARTATLSVSSTGPHNHESPSPYAPSVPISTNYKTFTTKHLDGGDVT